ncbi:hypothetical protein TYRP_014518 [Tyrophagus putrescentiae]|nr:hypothetical protein TYRP_014518 [Tyrophagus putrescentiae]
MDFFQGSPNAFQPPTGLPYTQPPSYGGFAPMNTNLNNFARLSPPQQWQSPPNVGNHQMWAHTVPNVMPWSSSGPYSPEGIFAFSQLHPPYEPILPNVPPQNGAYYPPSSFNQNNKRHISPLDGELESDANFDFESRRPVKKYISEDKVIEIFDRFHISEGDHYIVEDVADESMRNASGNNFKHNVVIEVLDDEEDRILELSPELKNAFQNGSSCITGKLMQDEKDKFSKAVVLWQPNTILKTLLNDSDDDASKDESEEANDNGGVEIEEIFSDDDEEMLNWESDVDQSNNIVEDDEELME